MKKLRVDIGTQGEPSFMTTIYLLSDKTYEVTPVSGGNGMVECTLVPDFNYTREISTYMEPIVGYALRPVASRNTGQDIVQGLPELPFAK